MKPIYTLCLAVGIALGISAATGRAADVFLRLKVVDPPAGKFRVTLGGFIHVESWYLPAQTVNVAGGQRSPWIDLRKWPLHRRLDREGGLAEWPAIKLSLARLGGNEPIRGCTFEVQLADKPEEQAVVLAFTERSGSDSIACLLPHPLREKKGEFETGSQMTARHLAWAREVTGGHARNLRKFDLITSVWGHYDPLLARQSTETLRLLGFNVLSGVPVSVLREAGMRTYTATWHLVPDPEKSVAEWNKGEAAQIARSMRVWAQSA